MQHEDHDVPPNIKKLSFFCSAGRLGRLARQKCDRGTVIIVFQALTFDYVDSQFGITSSTTTTYKTKTYIAAEELIK